MNTSSLWQQLSDNFTAIAASAGAAVVAVHGGRGAVASGIVWTGDTIVTVDHALPRGETASVTLQPDERVEARVVGRDPATDIAVLRLEQARGLPAPPLAETPLGIGELVMALGRSRRGNVVASAGIVSGLMGEWRGARGGVIESFIRPDLVLYRGMSGGPLINHQGAIIGMNTSALRPGSPVAIPASMLKRVSSELVTRGRVARPYLGVAMQPVAVPASLRATLKIEEEIGALVVHTEKDGPAERAGLIIGDVLIKLGSQAIDWGHDLRELVARLRPGERVEATILRGGALETATVEVGERPR